ncbi:MAG TPA: hypothetical protein VK901_01015 [Nitrospiraceae bacterium]|nr:hypothetical protein [Nitrospiraceae bacterium]
MYQRRDDGSEVRLVPRPLTAGQIWANGKETFKFEGIEDFETFNTTVPACLKITVISQETGADSTVKEGKDIKYYERGKGFIYKSGNNGFFDVTKILRQVRIVEIKPLTGLNSLIQQNQSCRLRHELFVFT